MLGRYGQNLVWRGRCGLCHVKKLGTKYHVSDGKLPSSESSWLDKHFRVITRLEIGYYIKWDKTRTRVISSD